jgi:hypothetical protein
MDREPNRYATPERDEIERQVRQTLSEIREAVDHLERTYRAGRITPAELTEEREVLRAQERALEGRIEG